MKAMVYYCLAEYDRIDFLHNNVGIVKVGGPVEASKESCKRVNAVNIKNLFLTSKAIIPQMEKRSGGVIG